MPLTAHRLLLVLAALWGLAALAMGTGLLVGSTPIGPRAVIGGLLDGDHETAAIVRGVRAPVVLLAALVGGWLATAGAAMQGLLRNPLADPYILGISGGAALGASVALAMGGGGAGGGLGLPAASFAGALGAVGLIQAVARAVPDGLGGRGVAWTLLLTGVVFNALAGASILVVYAFLSPERTQELLFWLMGSIAVGRASSGALLAAVLFATLALGVLYALSGRLNILALGDMEAAALGVRPRALRTAFFLLSSALVACAVAFSGLIGFVGLVVPHIVRLAFGVDHRLLLAACTPVGAAFLVLADALARGLFPLTGAVLPVGAVTALVGAPLFFLLLVRGLRSGGLPEADG